MSKDFFPPRPVLRPALYAYEDTNPQYAGLLKVGYTTVDAQSRVLQQYPTRKPGKPPYRIVLEESAMRSDGTVFADHDVHRIFARRCRRCSDAVMVLDRHDLVHRQYRILDRRRDG